LNFELLKENFIKDKSCKLALELINLELLIEIVISFERIEEDKGVIL